MRHKTRDWTLLKELAVAGQCVQWSNKVGCGGGWWTYSEQRGSCAAPGEVAFIVGEALAPHMAVMMSQAGSKSLSARCARRLVPELRHEPPVQSMRPNEYGAVWTLHRLLMVYLVDHAEALYEQGSVLLPLDQWRLLAQEAGVPRAALPRLIDSWRSGDDKTPPLIKEVAPDAITLADDHGPEREFIVQAGRQRVQGRRRGRAGKARKGYQRKQRR